MLVRFEKPYACVGVESDGGKVIRVAPMFNWALGLHIDDVIARARRRGWKVTEDVEKLYDTDRCLKNYF